MCLRLKAMQTTKVILSELYNVRDSGGIHSNIRPKESQFGPTRNMIESGVDVYHDTPTDHSVCFLGV